MTLPGIGMALSAAAAVPPRRCRTDTALPLTGARTRPRRLRWNGQGTELRVLTVSNGSLHSTTTTTTTTRGWTTGLLRETNPSCGGTVGMFRHGSMGIGLVPSSTIDSSIVRIQETEFFAALHSLSARSSQSRAQGILTGSARHCRLGRRC